MIMTECMTVMTKNVPERVLYNCLTVRVIGRLGIMSPCSMVGNRESSPPGRSCLHLHLEAMSVVKVNLTRGLSLAILWRPQLVISPCAESCPLAPSVDVGGPDHPIKRLEHTRIFAYSHTVNIEILAL